MFSTTVKDFANRYLRLLNLELRTLTEQRKESERILTILGQEEDRKVATFMPKVFYELDTTVIDKAFELYHNQVNNLISGESKYKFNPKNNFYKTPDAEVLYLFIRNYLPNTIVEVGSGNSTMIVRQAIHDGCLDTFHIAIDPSPRAQISEIVDQILELPLEKVNDASCIYELKENDILFIDSSHMLRFGNDLAVIFCELLPRLNSGVIVHFHDIFLPYDYPPLFATQFPEWGEQYLLWSLLCNSSHKILWPGYYLQKSFPKITDKLPFMGLNTAQSFWLRICHD